VRSKTIHLFTVKNTENGGNELFSLEHSTMD